MPADVRRALYVLIVTVVEFFAVHLRSSEATSPGGGPQHIWASSGTVLGALRHQDLIPWDDDADFCVAKSRVTDQLLAIANARAEDGGSATRHRSADDADGTAMSRALAYLEERGVSFCAAPRVGLRFFLSPPRSTAAPQNAATFPFTDVFIMQRVPSLEVLAAKFPRVAAKMAGDRLKISATDVRTDGNDGSDCEDDDALRLASTASSSTAIYVIDDPHGRELWPADAFYEHQVAPSALVWRRDFGGAQLLCVASADFPGLPVPASSEAYLTRAYGADWRSVARSHDIDHRTLLMVNTTHAPLEEALKTMSSRQ